MLKRLDLQISTDVNPIVFAFPRALHILTFALSSQTGEILWKLLPEGAEPVASNNGRFWSTPVPDEMISTDCGETSAVIEIEHMVPALESIRYGEVPTGYGAAQVAPPLRRGESYHAVFMAEEGHGGGAFVVGDASSNAR